MATDRGLGRTLADIRADLEAAGAAAHHSPLFGDLERVLAGAEPRASEFLELTAGEAWGMLLEMPPAKRLAWLGNILEAARRGSPGAGIYVTREQMTVNRPDAVSALKARTARLLDDPPAGLGVDGCTCPHCAPGEPE